MYCISVSYITAGVEIRKKLAFTSRQREGIIKKSLLKRISPSVYCCVPATELRFSLTAAERHSGLLCQFFRNQADSELTSLLPML